MGSKILLAALLMLTPTMVFGAITLPHTVNCDCDAWEYSGSAPSCDSLELGGSGTAGAPGTQITADAAYSGGTGKGMRFYKGDGSNTDSQPLGFTFSAAQTELWIRWYMRFQSGFAWSALDYCKLLYLYTGGSTQAIPEFAWTDQIWIFAQGPSEGYQIGVESGGFSTIYGATSNGSWACFEIHVKMDTNQSNGVGEIWVNGTRIAYSNTVDWSNGDATAKLGWTHFHFHSNQKAPNNGGYEYVDYDEMAISNTGYIGPLGSGSSSPASVGVGFAGVGWQ